MKTARTIGLVLLIVALVTTLSFAKAPKSKIVNTVHDLRSTLGGASFTLCNFCHVAHKTAAPDITPPASAGPYLWNHVLSSVVSYGVYTSDTFKGYNTDIKDLGTGGGGSINASNLCLSCHDGTVGINYWYERVTGSNYQPLPNGNNVFVNISAQIKDLTQTHPVNFTYDATLATKAGILTPASTSSVDSAGEVPLFQGKMQCATCHDPHNGDSSIFEQSFPTQASGSFCTYCHL